jgi:hypothetical protein
MAAIVSGRTCRNYRTFCAPQQKNLAFLADGPKIRIMLQRNMAT